jgi:hypothetical protein
MTPENVFNDPALEQAVQEIRGEAVDPAVIEASAARVWARLAEAAAGQLRSQPIRGCQDFQALIPDFKAGTLPADRALLLKDHLHECVACRKVYLGQDSRPVLLTKKRILRPVPRWTLAAAVIATAAGLSVWVAYDRFGIPTGHAVIQSVNGTLFEVSPDGIHTLSAGQDLPAGAEIRTAKDSTAMLRLRDGSTVELREHADLSEIESGADLTLQLRRGSIIVQAAHRRNSHLYVTTPDCRVAVTGTIFGVSSGVKGSRVSVIQGEVHVTQNNAERVLHPGDQTVTTAELEPEPVKEDIGWSRNRDRYWRQLAGLRSGIGQLHLPGLRYTSKLLDRLPASTVFFAGIPNLAQYLGNAEALFEQKMEQSPELRGVFPRPASRAAAMIDKLRAASEYFGDEIAIVAVQGPDGSMDAPVFFAELKRDGFGQFLKREGLPLPLQARNGMVVFGPVAAAVERFAPALDNASGGFRGTPLYARIADVYRDGAGILFCVDLSHTGAPLAGGRFFIAQQKEVNGQMEARASLGFAAARSGMAAWLAAPAPMGSLEYISRDATVVAAFIAQSPASVIDAVASLFHRNAAVGGEFSAALGGEVSLAIDGPAFPVPSWKLVAEVYDPARVQTSLQHRVDAFNQQAAKTGHPRLQLTSESAQGRTFYGIALAGAGPLAEAHYTFADGYLVAAPTRELVSHALAIKQMGASIAHSSTFMSMTPRDRHADFSALLYENLGTTLAPLAGLAGLLGPVSRQQQDALQRLGNVKPTMIAAYGEPDRITVAGNSNVLGDSLADFMSGNVAGIVGSVIPLRR